MITFIPPRLLPRFVHLLLRLWPIGCAMLAAGLPARAAEDLGKQAFDLRAGAAEPALKQFSEQSGQQVIFPTDIVKGVRTRGVKGTFTAREALAQMLAGTPLYASQDEKTGALAIVRAEPAESAASPAKKKAATPYGAKPAEEETIILSPFEVNAADDTGYRATNTLDGSRLNTALRDTPGAISVFTRDLLDDLGVTDVMEILRYDVSTEESFGDDAFAGPGSEQGKAGDMGLGYNWRTRGLQSSSSTNGFNTTGKTDIYNIESVGSTRGPNAILFGSGAAGGVLNFRTKAANPVRNSNSIELKVGDYDTYRGSVDFNRVLIKDKLAFRAMGMAETRGSHSPHLYTDKDSVTFAAQYRFNRDTNVNVSYENTRTEGVRGRPWNPLDSVSQFRNQLERGQVVWDPVQERYETLNGAVVGAAAGARVRKGSGCGK